MKDKYRSLLQQHRAEKEAEAARLHEMQVNGTVAVAKESEAADLFSIGGGQNDYHPIKSRKTFSDGCKDGERIPQISTFHCLGSLRGIQEMNPLQRNEAGELEWNSAYIDGERTGNPNSPWRSLHGMEGPLRDYMNEVGTKRLVQFAGMVNRLGNSCPFAVGVFAIGTPVTRIPDNPLYSQKVDEIIEAYYKASKSATSKHEKFISLIAVIPPTQQLELRESEGAFYYINDSDTAAASATSYQQHGASNAVNQLSNLKYAKTWMGVTMESIKSDVIIPDLNLYPELVSSVRARAGETVDSHSLIKNRSRLMVYIEHNWHNLGQTGPFMPILWEFPKVMLAYLESKKSEGSSTESVSAIEIFEDPSNQGTIPVVLVPKDVVDKAVHDIKNRLENLPFAGLSKHQIFVARLDADRWDEPGRVAGSSIMEAMNSTDSLCQVTVSITNSFGVMDGSTRGYGAR